MQIFFRVDASIEIGTGHVMRCLTLAHALNNYGAQCLFISRDHPGHLHEIIEKNGFAVHRLSQPRPVLLSSKQSKDNTGYADWLGTTEQQDAAECKPLLINQRPDLLVVDHYALGAAWESELGAYVDQVMAIDDLANRPHNCARLLDQNPGRNSDDYLGLVTQSCKILAGPDYALLRPEFASLRGDSLARRKNPALKRLLITLGGVDKCNHTTRVLRAVRQSGLSPECSITVVMGANSPWLQQVRDEMSDFPWPIAIEVEVSCMARIMADSDLAIGAAGMTALERCCMGLPTLTVIAAENQIPGARALENAGALAILPPEDEALSKLPKMLEMYALPAKLSEMQRSCVKITDGTGAAKVALELAHG